MNNILVVGEIERGLATELNAVTKLFIGLSFSLLIVLQSSLLPVLIVLVGIFFVNFIIYGIRRTSGIIYSIRHLLVLVPLSVFLFLFSFDLSTRINLTLSTTIRLVSITLAFSPLSRSTTPDDLLSGLLSIRLPPLLSWIIVSTYRQSIFVLEELQVTSKLYLRDAPSGKIASIRYYSDAVVKLLVIAYGRAIVRSKEYADTLMVRGWTGAHRDLPLEASSFSLVDIIFISLVSVFSILMFVLY